LRSTQTVSGESIFFKFIPNQSLSIHENSILTRKIGRSIVFKKFVIKRRCVEMGKEH